MVLVLLNNDIIRLLFTLQRLRLFITVVVVRVTIIILLVLTHVDNLSPHLSTNLQQIAFLFTFIGKPICVRIQLLKSGACVTISLQIRNFVFVFVFDLGIENYLANSSVKPFGYSGREYYFNLWWFEQYFILQRAFNQLLNLQNMYKYKLLQCNL